ncbi:hypothetical protein SO802_033112 [Lithocarpus litseifolius]|uniref:Uncharacterized protein n=1 Tax=Lithocarpus litseifolius TaxID=425828 RepID=A0AAW2BEX7_9ROSI
MTTKFNQDMYDKMRSKKNKPLSNLGKRTVRITRKGPSVAPAVPITPIVPGTKTTKTASPAISVEEITTPISKRPCLTDKGKEKADSRLSSVWDDAGAGMERAHEVVTIEDLKVFSSVPSNEGVAHHIHKLIQVMYLCNFSPPFLFLFFFLIVLKASIFFSGIEGESSYHLGVPHSRRLHL